MKYIWYEIYFINIFYIVKKINPPPLTLHPPEQFLGEFKQSSGLALPIKTINHPNPYFLFKGFASTTTQNTHTHNIKSFETLTGGKAQLSKTHNICSSHTFFNQGLRYSIQFVLTMFIIIASSYYSTASALRCFFIPISIHTITFFLQRGLGVQFSRLHQSLVRFL